MASIRSVARAALLALGIASAAVGQAQTFGSSGGTPVSLISAPGSFNPTWFGSAADYSGLFDLSSLLRGAELSISGPAQLEFTLAGFEASYNNAFVVGDQQLNNRLGGESQLGSTFSFRQQSAGPLSFGFLSNGLGSLLQNGFAQVGVFLSQDRQQALIAFNDSFRGDADFDDMLVHVSITPVPEPETALLWLAGLAGLGGWLRHRRGARQMV